MTHSTVSTAANRPTQLLTWTLLLVPALGVPNQYVLQDTLKSALFAIGVGWAYACWQPQAAQKGHATRIYVSAFLLLPLSWTLYAACSTWWGHSYLGTVEALRWALVSIFVLLCVHAIPTHHFIWLVRGLHTGATMAALWVALQYWVGIDWFPQAAFPASTFANRNFFAEFAVSVLPFSLWLLLHSATRVALMCTGISTALLAVSIMLAGTRSALIAMSMALPAMGFIGWRYRALWPWHGIPTTHRIQGIAFAIAVAVLLSLIPTNNPLALQVSTSGRALDRLANRATSLSAQTEYTEGSFSERVLMWKATWRMASAHPFAGVGAGNWEVEIPLFQPAETDKEYDFYAHNDIFQFLSEYGLLFGGISFAFAIALWCKAASNTKQTVAQSASLGTLQAFALLSLISLSIVASAGFPLHLAACTMVLALCFGILAATDATRMPTSLRHGLNLTIPKSFWACLQSTRWLVVAVALTLSAVAFVAESHLVQALLNSARLGMLTARNLPAPATLRSEVLHDLEVGIALSPHNRKLIALVGDRMLAARDLPTAIQAWEAATRSRPHVAALWSNLALAYADQGNYTLARAALQHFAQLKPNSSLNVSIGILLLHRAGRSNEALCQIRQHLQTGEYDWQVLQAGLTVAVETQEWPLAIQILHLRNAQWPEQAADGNFQLGIVHMKRSSGDSQQALTAFRTGLEQTPAADQAAYRIRVPPPYREQM